MGNMKYRAALYMRLSKDDGGAESSSIQSQRSLLFSYAGEHGFSVYNEYVDDGWSGTNFDRPEFLHMLSDIEAGQVNLVLVKDLSRLGRDYIGTGRYTEIYFPSKGVRCIAVNDGYDSLGGDSDLIPFKHVMNEMYARDISRKIRSALAVRMGAGVYIGNFAPYGYQKDPAWRGRLEPDPEAAAVVQRIFEAAAVEADFTPRAMAERLNAEGILPPALYRCQKHLGLKPENCTRAGKWTANAIVKLIHNPVYLGHLVQGKTRKVSFRSGPVPVREPGDYIVARDTHEALVTPEIFCAAERRISRKPGRLSAAVFRERAAEETGEHCTAQNAHAWLWASDATPPASRDAGSSTRRGSGSSPF